MSDNKSGSRQRRQNDATLSNLARDALLKVRKAKIEAYESRDIPSTLDKLDEAEEKIQRLRELIGGDQVHASAEPGRQVRDGEW